MTKQFGKIDTRPMTTVRVQVLETHPETNEFKPYFTSLGFPKGLFIDIKVPTEYVIDELKDGGLVLTLDGWTALLVAYTTAIQDIEKKKADSLPRFVPPK